MGVLVATVILLVVIFLSMPSAHAQSLEPENFTVSPGDFTVRNAPPLGEPYFIEQKLRIHNGASIERNFVLSVRAPPPENLKPEYEPIPNENWVILIPAVIPIEKNSDNLVDISFNIPRWENLTNQRWEAWISVTRAALPGEVIEIELVCKVYIETTKDLPPPPSPGNESLPLLFVIIIILVVGVVGIAFLYGKSARRRRGEMEFSYKSSV